MGYPGDRGQPGGWENEQPPPPPYGENPRRPEAPRYGQSPFDPPPEDTTPPPPGTGDSDLSGAFARPVGRPGGYGSGDDGPGPTAGPDDFAAGTYDFGGHRRTDPPAGAAGAMGGPANPYPPGAPNAFESDPFEPSPYGSPRKGSGRYEPGTPGGFGPTPPGGRRRLPLIIGASVAGLGVLVAGGIGLSAILKDDAPEAKPGTPAAGKGGTAGTAPSSATSPSPTPSAALGALLKSRATDPKALTVTEIFGRKSFTQQKTKYVMTARNATTNCTKAVNGAKFAATLKKAGCTQILRATFARSDGRLIGTIGVVNLRTEPLAKAAAKAALAKDAWVLPLAGGGTTKTIGTGIALGTAETRGHYLLTTWVQQPSGKEMSAALRKQVTEFARAVPLGSNLATALEYRGIEGKPYGK